MYILTAFLLIILDFLFTYIWFTVFHMYSRVIQFYIYIYIYIHLFFSIISYYKVLNIVPYALQ